MATGKKIGARIVIDGEQEFRQALNQSKTVLKEFDSEMKLVTAQFKNNSQSMDALKAKQAVYQKQQQELTKQSKLLVDQIEKANVAYRKAEEVQDQTADKVKDLERALESAKKQYGENSDEVRELELELKDANTEYEKQGRAITNLETQISKWNTQLNNTNTQLAETDSAMTEVNDSIENYGKEVVDSEGKTKKFGITVSEASEGTDKLKISLGSLVSAQVVVDVLRNCANAIKEVASAALEVGTKFTASMSNVEALSGATGETLAQLTAKAKEMGATTIYSASESADAFSYMALAGWDVEEMLEGIEPVLTLAAAANMDLAEASDIVTDYLTAFGLSAQDAAHFSDVMATAMSTSNTTVELLGESYKNCAATAGSMGIAVEDVTAVLATMANAGVKGGEAGTALNTIMTRLATNTKDCADELSKYGVEVYDSFGNMNALSDILEGLEHVWANLTQEEQANLAKLIAGTSQYSKFQTIMLGVSEAAQEGGQSFYDYAEALRECDGSASAMAKTMQDNLTGDITILKSALEGLGIATEGVFDDAFRDAVQGATDAVSRLENAVSNGDLGVSLANLGESLAELTDNLVTSAEEGLPGFIDGLTKLIDNLDVIGGAISGVAAGWLAYQAASLAATIATEGLTVALNANPIGLLVGVIAGVATAFWSFSEAADEAAEKMSGVSTEVEREINVSKNLTSNIQEASARRAEEAANIDKQAQAAKRLTEELFEGNASQERQAQIIEELKSLYPELNVSLSEEGEIVGATKEQIDRYIESSVQMSKVEAAKKHITETAEEQLEAEMALADKAEELKKAEEKLAEAEREYNIEAQKHVDMNGNLVEVQNEYSLAVDSARADVKALGEEYSNIQNTLIDLGAEQNRYLEFVGNTEPLISATGETQALGEAEQQVAEISEELTEEFQKLYESIQSSVQSSLDLTQQWSQDWSTNTGEMTSNIQSQIEGVQNWADNFDQLANSAEVSIDSRVLKYLADMGTEGAGLVQQLVDTLKESPEQLQDFADTMAEYLSLSDEVAAQIEQTYADCIINGMEAASKAVEENSEPITEAMTLAATESKDAFNEAWGSDGETAQEFYTAGKAAADSVAKGVTENSSTLKTETKKVADEGLKAVQTAWGVSGSNSSKFNTEGKNAVTSIANGMKSQENQATSTASQMAESIAKAFESVLNHDRGFKAGESYAKGVLDGLNSKKKEINNLKNELGSGGGGSSEGGDGGDGGGGGEQPQASGASRSSASMAVRNLDRSVSTTKASRAVREEAELAESVDRLANVVEEYLPQSTEGTTNVNVELSGDAADIFGVVRTQNSKLVRSTGYHALS